MRLIVLATLVAAVGLSRAASQSTHAAPDVFTGLPADSARLVAVSLGEGSEPSISPDGRTVAFVTSFEVRTYDLLTGAQHVLCEVENPHAVSWTSDGIQLAFQGDDSVVTRGKFWIWIVNRDGSGLHRISSGPHDQYPVWSHDGRSLAWSRGEQLWQGDRDARAGRFLTKAPEAYHFQRALCWLPDGRHLRYVLEAEFGAVSTVRVVGADSTDDSQDPWMTSSVVGGLVGASSDDGTFMYRGLGHMLEFYGDLRSGAPIRRCFVQDSVVVSHLALATDKSFAVFDDFEPESGPDKLWLVRWKQAKGH